MLSDIIFSGRVVLALVTLVAVSPSVRAAADIVFETSGAVARFSPRNGALLSLRAADGVERVLPASELFTLCFLDDCGEETVMKSSDFTFRRDGGTFTYGRTGGPSVTVAVRGADGVFRFRPVVRDWPAGLRLHWFDGPQVVVSTAGRLYWPYQDGYEVFDYTTRTNKVAWNQYRPLGWQRRCTSASAIYPGRCQLQFLAHYRDGRALYFGAHDAKHTAKEVEWEYLGPDRARLTLQTACGDAADGVYESAFDYLLRPYAGDWMEACEFYRDWLRELPAFASRPSRPSWAEESPVTLIYPIKGEGMDNTVEMQTNRYYPYTNVLAEVDRYSRLLDSKIMALPMHWEGTAPWCPPYVWPPYGGETELAKLRDALHARGDLLGLYCSGTGWTQVSTVDPSYSRTQEFLDKGLVRYMMRGPKGEIDAAVCNHTRAQRFGYDICIAGEWGRRTVIDEVMKMARFGIDYCQFFDQNYGGGGGMCWCRTHAHPSVPGSWQVAAMRSLQDDIVASVRGIGSSMTIGCEGAAATPYVGNLFFNDARSFFSSRLGRPVPGVPFVLHEWMCNFSGNQCGTGSDAFYRWAYSFHCGDMLSLILGPDGKLVSRWARPWTDPLPDQDALIGLVRSLNALRRKYPQFLLRGRMIRPPVKIVAGAAVVPGEGLKAPVSEALWSFWQDDRGNRIGFITNWRTVPVEVGLVRAGGCEERLRLRPLETAEIPLARR